MSVKKTVSPVTPVAGTAPASAELLAASTAATEARKVKNAQLLAVLYKRAAEWTREYKACTGKTVKPEIDKVKLTFISAAELCAQALNICHYNELLPDDVDANAVAISVTELLTAAIAYYTTDAYKSAPDKVKQAVKAQQDATDKYESLNDRFILLRNKAQQ